MPTYQDLYEMPVSYRACREMRNTPTRPPYSAAQNAPHKPLPIPPLPLKHTSMVLLPKRLYQPLCLLSAPHNLPASLRFALRALAPYARLVRVQERYNVLERLVRREPEDEHGVRRRLQKR